MENISHVLVDCNSARKIWRMVHFANKVYSLTEQSMVDVLQKMTEMFKSCIIRIVGGYVLGNLACKKQFPFLKEESRSSDLFSKS